MQLDQIRALFPALQQDTIFLENAGGSQLPSPAIDRMTAYLRDSFVQLEAGYAQSNRATAIVHDAHEFCATLMNAQDVGHVTLGPSCSVLCRLLADAYAPTIREGDEIVLAETAHEANVGPWLRLETQGARLRWWRLDPQTLECPLEDLDDLLGERTRLVVLPHVSNLLGDIVDLTEVCRRAHGVGAQVVADGVAFAPHRAMDMAAWKVDWYVFSNYKVYGPHMAALFGTHEAYAPLVGPNHYFVPADAIPYKFELGGANHEGCAGLLGTEDYLSQLGGDPGPRVSRTTIERAFDRMTELELPAQKILVDFLRQATGVRIIGPATAGRERVGTVSFTHDRLSSAEITGRLQERGVAMRHGHMYAHRLCLALGLDPDDGVVRISLVHYNSVEEIHRTAEILDAILGVHS